MKKLIIPAILSTDKDNYKKKLQQVEGLVEKVQIDVMDGRFVENKTIPLDKLGAVKTKTYLEFHMMVDAPWAYIPAVAALGGKTYIFHIEACHNEKNVHDILERIIQYKMQPSIAINPETPLKAVLPYLSQLEHVLIMTVRPGQMGQKFISSALQKVRAIRRKYSNINIEVDGGINDKTLPKALKAGANYFVIGSAIYGKENAEQAIEKYKKIVK
ncbi:MAG: ribulose-phosphate 3-epimerase [Candidatus Aenigmarchaeota archaeon]|nr:ribulose-phosphate 3-epimerase [Candidatus Aenigmarchaeota archaeon]